MYYTIYIKKTDPFTQAWSMQSRGWMTFAQVLQTVAALEKRINHPPHAIKVTATETKDGCGKRGGGKVILKWSRIEERNAVLVDRVELARKELATNGINI